MLQAYAALDAEVNYCQGMNFLAALMLTWLPREAEAFGALVLVMQDRGLRELYKADMQMLQVPVSEHPSHLQDNRPANMYREEMPCLEDAPTSRVHGLGLLSGS